MKQKFNLFLLLILILSIVLIILSASLYYFSGGNEHDYGITIDAGSSKTKLFLYDWSPNKINDTGFVKEKATHKLAISIDEHANKIPELLKLLTGALSTISHKIGATPDSFTIPIYLGATAGMRLLKAVNSGDAEKILKEIKINFNQYTASQKRFKVKDVEIITGEKEGLYAWISVNYLMKYVPKKDQNKLKGTVGILDMGGASAQIAFESYCEGNEICDREKKLMRTSLIPNEETKLFGTKYNIYSHSNLCFGNDDARRRYQVVVISKSNFEKVVYDPCTHTNQLDRVIKKSDILEDICTSNDKTRSDLKFDNYTFKAKPDIKKCMEYTKLIVDKEYVGKYFPTNARENEFTLLTEAPPQDTTFYALSTYYYTTSQLRKNVDNINFQNEEQLRKEIDQYCNTAWADIVKLKSKKDEISYLHNYCFALNYMFNNLKFVYKFSGKQFSNIEFREKLQGHDLGWSLGYMLQATNLIPEGTPKSPLLNRTQFISLSVFGLILFLAVLFVYLKTKVFAKGNDERDNIKF